MRTKPLISHKLYVLSSVMPLTLIEHNPLSNCGGFNSIRPLFHLNCKFGQQNPAAGMYPPFLLSENQAFQPPEEHTLDFLSLRLQTS